MENKKEKETTLSLRNKRRFYNIQRECELGPTEHEV